MRRWTGIRAPRPVCLVALAAVTVGVFLTWTSDGAVDLDGVQGPNDGWLVLILAAFALVWIGALERRSWTAVLAVLGSALVMSWTAVGDWLDARDVSGASAGLGLLFVVLGSALFAAVSVRVAVDLIRSAPRG